MDNALLTRRSQLRPRRESWADEDRDHSRSDNEQRLGDEEEYVDGEDAQDEEEEEDDDDDEEDRASQHKVRRPRRTGARRRRIHFEISELQQLYHLPLKTAAERLGICEAALKRICRRNQIRKWPYRQLQSIRRRMSGLEDQENNRPSSSASNCKIDSSTTPRSPPKAKSFRKSQAHSERASMFLLPHELRREQQEHASLQADSGESALVKREKLELLEEERRRVISLAHLASQSRRCKLDTPKQESSTSRMEFDNTLTFEELLAWSVPTFDSLEAGPTSTQLNGDVREGYRCDEKRDSALLLLANVCTNEEKIRELHARRLRVRRRDEDWQQRSSSSEQSMVSAPPLHYRIGQPQPAPWQ